MTREEAIKVLIHLREIIKTMPKALCKLPNVEEHKEEDVIALRMAIESLSACPQNDTNIGTSDLISREDAIEVVCGVVIDEFDVSPNKGYEVAEKVLSALPSADRPKYNLELIADIVRQLEHLDSYVADTCDRPKGEWIADEHRNEIICSVCGNEKTYGDEPVDKKFYPPFCQWCGADMRKEEK